MNMKRIFTCTLLFFGTSTVFSACPLGWAEFNEDCVWFSPHTASSWIAAETDCRNKGAWLASDDSEEKHDFIKSLATILRNWHIYEFFIGANDFAFEGTYRWLETGLGVGPFVRWGPGQPNGTKGENCLTLAWEGSDLVWYDEPCSPNPHLHVSHGHQKPGTYNYICEKPSNISGQMVIG